VDELVRRARAFGARLALRIVQRARHRLFLEPRTLLIGPEAGAGHEAPRIVHERFGCRRSNECIAHHGPGNRRAAAQKSTAVKQPVSGNLLQLLRFSL